MNKIKMIKTINAKKYDLEDRTYEFAKNMRLFVEKFQKPSVILKTENK